MKTLHLFALAPIAVLLNVVSFEALSQANSDHRGLIRQCLSEMERADRLYIEVEQLSRRSFQLGEANRNELARLRTQDNNLRILQNNVNNCNVAANYFYCTNQANNLSSYRIIHQRAINAYEASRREHIEVNRRHDEAERNLLRSIATWERVCDDAISKERRRIVWSEECRNFSYRSDEYKRIAYSEGSMCY